MTQRTHNHAHRSSQQTLVPHFLLHRRWERVAGREEGTPGRSGRGHVVAAAPPARTPSRGSGSSEEEKRMDRGSVSREYVNLEWVVSGKWSMLTCFCRRKDAVLPVVSSSFIRVQAPPRPYPPIPPTFRCSLRGTLPRYFSFSPSLEKAVEIVDVGLYPAVGVVGRGSSRV